MNSLRQSGTILWVAHRLDIDYIAARIGIDHVALGSDFDGTQVPQDLEDASGLQRLLAALRERGFRGKKLEKIANTNWLRVLKETWKR